MIRTAVIILPVAGFLIAWAQPSAGAQDTTLDSSRSRPHADDKTVNPGSKDAPRRFESLEAYLAWLEQRAQLGGTWYREVRPGLYERQDGGLRLPDGDRQPRYYTREELADRFGFSR